MAGSVPGRKVALDHHRDVVIWHGHGKHHGTCMNSLSVIVDDTPTDRGKRLG